MTTNLRKTLIASSAALALVGGTAAPASAATPTWWEDFGFDLPIFWSPQPPTDEAPEPPADETPAPPVGGSPQPPKDEKPEPPKDETPAPPKDEKPEPPKDEKPAPPKDEKPEDDGDGIDDDAVAAEMLRLMNDAREKEGSGPLEERDELDAIADRWSEKMAGEENLYHNPNFGEEVMETGASTAGENVAMSSATPEDPKALAQQLFDQWMASPGHRENIMNDSFDRIGFGVDTTEGGGHYATQNFAG